MERVWLHNKATGGYFHCPAGAAENWRGFGWEPSDPPPAENLATAERDAWLKQQQEQREAAKKTTKPARRGETEES